MRAGRGQAETPHNNKQATRIFLIEEALNALLAAPFAPPWVRSDPFLPSTNLSHDNILSHS
jgi:hypothetical protein